MPTTHRCTSARCERRATVRCFECENYFCPRHLAVIDLEMTARTLRLRVCANCLQGYRADPELHTLLQPAPIHNH